MIDKVDILDPVRVWQMACGELQLQLTGATFDTWLSRARLIGVEQGQLVIGVHNQSAKNWLEHRLDAMITRTLSGIVGHPVSVRFVVDKTTEPAAPPPRIEQIDTPAALPEMPDLKRVGFFPVSQYESHFWAPLLGRVAWRVWEIVRSSDIRSEKSEWTPERRWSAPALARMVPCGPQAIVGVNRNSGRQPGALDKLEAMQIGRFRRQGDLHDPHTMYVVSVAVRLPLLSPVQVMGLTDTLRHKHDQWLEQYGFDPRDWFIDSVNST